MALKLARIIRFDPTLSVAQKIERIEPMAQAFAQISNTHDLAFFCIGEQSIYAILAGMLRADNAPIDEIIRIRDKHLAALQKVMTLAKQDPVVKEMFETTYKTDDVVAWELNKLLHSPHPQLAELRENPKYMEMLQKWAK